MNSQRRKRELPSTSKEIERCTSPQRSRDSSRTSDDSIDRLTTAMTPFFEHPQQQMKANATVVGGDVVPVFNPENNQRLTVAEWCQKVDELSEIYQWSEETTIYYAMSKLKGLAEIWYKSQPTIKLTWEQWKQKLEIEFPTNRDYCTELHEMLNRKKTPDESYTKFYYEKSALLNKCRIFGRDAVSCIIGGISDVIVKTGATAGNHQTPESLYGYLSTLSFLPTTPLPNKQFSKHNFKAKYRGVTRPLHKTFPYQSSKDITCYKCNQPGHTANVCQKFQKRECTFCQRNGHLEVDCFSKKKTQKTKPTI